MKLIVNLGNSDCKVVEQGNDVDFLFRQKESFARRTQSLARYFNDVGDSSGLDRSGIFAKPFPLKDDQSDSVHVIKSMKFEILASEIEQIESLTGEQINTVLAVATRQGADTFSSQDTCFLFDILRGPAGKALFPGISFESRVLTCDPSDYGKVYEEYVKWFSDTDTGHCAIAIAQGTPAMSYALSLCGALYAPKARQFYAAHQNSSRMYPLRLFSDQENERQVGRFVTLMDAGEYGRACESASHGILAQVDGLGLLVDYFIARGDYRFADARGKYTELIKVNAGLASIVEDCSRSLDVLIRLVPEARDKDIDYADSEIPYLLFETLQNIRFYFMHGHYFLSIAFMTSFLDLCQISAISKELGFSDVHYVSKTNSYPVLDDYVGKYIIPYDSGSSTQKEKYKNIFDCWNHETHSLSANGASLSCLIKWIARRRPDASDWIKKCEKVQDGQGRFFDLRKLRNKLPIAHSAQGIGREEIEGVIKGDTFEGLLDDLEELVWEINPCLVKIPSYRLLAKEIGEAVRKQIAAII